MVILNCRSSYFRRILSTNKKKNDETLINIKLSNIKPEIFQLILRYIYGGSLSLEEFDTSDIIKILITASELSLQELIPHLQSFLIKNKENWMEQNFNLIYQISFENDYSFLDLQKFCTELFSKQPGKIFNSPDFTSISEKILTSLIQNDLQISEVQIWEHVLKWAIAQNPGLSLDPSSYSKDDFNVLKNTLQRRYSKKLYKSLIECFFDNDYNPSDKLGPKIIKETIIRESIDSKIITVQYVELISKWIGKLEIMDEIKDLYEFKLIFRGSRDGFTPENFMKFVIINIIP
ncbi:hypothetical protein RirG_243030 [Rhizophagus irregularis DAOM 197198w]|uniref:BTB domain-containing protein n=1 Tax=Rhizophagus irregularis (strain DAOM 197198w) TaxID=1432141 RepID=A0A015JEZ1_RHIIW|nr:hypothetical protein RirG_243030 [Rhizophagus irregularis DAOM 197198w]